MRLIATRSPILFVATVALFAAGCGGSDVLQSPVSPTAVTGSAALSPGDSLQAPTPGAAITALAKGGARKGDDEKKAGDDRARGEGGGGADEDEGPGRSGERKPARAGVNLSGRVSVVTASSLTVHGVEVMVDETTIIRHGNRRLTLVDIRVGNQAQVKGIQVGPVVTAFEVKVEDVGGDDDDDDEVDDGLPRVELEGIVSDLLSTLTCPVVTFTVDATPVTTSMTTVFSGSLCSALADGRFVEVRATRQLDGTLLVQRVTADDADDDEVEGVTSAPSGTCPALSFNVAAVEVTVTGATIFTGVTCEQIAAGAVVTVEVNGTRMADGSLVAATVTRD